MGSYDQLIQQYQQHQNQSQFRLQMSAVNQSFRDQGMKSMQTAQSNPDPFGALGLFSVVHISDPNLKYLAHGIDLTTLGLNLNSTENLYKTFRSPWSDEPAKGDPEFSVLQCYYAKQSPSLHVRYSLFCFLISLPLSFCVLLRPSLFVSCSKVIFQSFQWKLYFTYFTGAF